MASFAHNLRRSADRLAGLPSPALFFLFWAAVALGHMTLLRLPYYWDEAGYYIPAALDFFHRFTLIPEYTNAHPPLPNAVLGALWHVAGYHILTTRLVVCAVAAAGLLAVFRMAQGLLGNAAAVAVTLLTAIYPIWFVQSTLAHADIFAAAFTLWALTLYFRSRQGEFDQEEDEPPRGQWKIALLFSLSALSKETAILYPLTLAALHSYLALGSRKAPGRRRRNQLRWAATNAFPVLPLAAWYLYHWSRTGFVFGNAAYLQYNATANFSARHIVIALGFRFLHLFWQRNIWVPLALALLCLFATRRLPPFRVRSAPVWRAILVLIAANWIAFSVLGGALLTRYLLPAYPLLLIACIAAWRDATVRWLWFAAATAVAFLAGLWWSPPFAYTPEDNLTYRDMIVVHQHAVTFLQGHFPGATVLTSFPGAGEIKKPELGYANRVWATTEIDNFSAAEVAKAAAEPERFDTAFVFTTQYRPPALARELALHPDTARGREFNAIRDLHPDEIAAVLRGRVVWEEERNGEWAAILQFDRRRIAQGTTSVP